MSYEYNITKCAEAIIKSDILVVTAGAGIGIDSGLPDFRGDKGFWNAYPMYEKLGINFYDAANPIHFANDPKFGWGFYGHRLEMYRKTIPHSGFDTILRWVNEMNKQYFIITSNVDGQFQKAGFSDEYTHEIHGSIHYLQCTEPCNNEIWENNEQIHIEYNSMRAENISLCKSCGSVARPNILMFNDYSWLPKRSEIQAEKLSQFLHKYKDHSITVIEIGAGTAIPSIRYTSERLQRNYGAFIIRINLRESHISIPNIGLPLSAKAAITSIDEKLKELI